MLGIADFPSALQPQFQPEALGNVLRGQLNARVEQNATGHFDGMYVQAKPGSYTVTISASNHEVGHVSTRKTLGMVHALRVALCS